MPVVGEFHGHYWNADDGVGPPVAGPGRGGYPAWQASAIVASLFGALAAWLEHVWALAIWWWALVRAIHTLPIAQRQVVQSVVETMTAPAYVHARTAVRETAYAPHFTRPAMWVPYGRMLKEQPRRAENIFRHVKACERTRELAGPVPSADCDLVVQLAYQEYRIQPWPL